METLKKKFNIIPDPEQAKAPAPENENTIEPLEKPRQSIEQIKQRLFDPYVISREYDQKGRQAHASEITRRRQESQSLRADIGGRENILEQIEQQASVLSALKAEKLLALEQRTEHILVRLKDIFNIKDKSAGVLETEIGSLTTEIEKLVTQTEEARVELAMLKQQQESIPDPKKLLEAYYEKMETVPLTNAEKRELLRPEILAELSTEEYIALWRRLNPHFLSHVTRQGFRDHNAMVYHSAGLQEFHDGLVSVLQDEKILRPPIAVREGLRSRDETAVRKFLEDWVLQAENEEEAKERFDALLHKSLATAPKYPDQTAVHFATQIVADGYYGGERSNEAFFLYPSDVLVSQHQFAFNGWEKDFTQPQSETKWNDVFVWPLSVDNPGIAVDVGMVFLPEHTPVDPKTGSRYASEISIVEGEEKRIMIEDESLVRAFVEWAKNLNEQSLPMVAYKDWEDEKNYWKKREREKICLDAFRQEMQKLGFDEEAAGRLGGDVFKERCQMGRLDWQKNIPFEESMQRLLRQSGSNWKLAEQTISSKEYWEAYFAQHPQQKPKHLIFYDGDPTAAIYEFQQKNNIGRADTSETEGKLLGFDDKHIVDMHEDPRAKIGQDELVETAHQIITDHYMSHSR